MLQCVKIASMLTVLALASAADGPFDPPADWFIERIPGYSPPAAALSSWANVEEVVVAIPPAFADPTDTGFLGYVMFWRFQGGSSLTMRALPDALDAYYASLRRQPGIETFPPELLQRMEMAPSENWQFRLRTISCDDGDLALVFAVSGSPNPADAPWSELEAVRDQATC